MQCITDQARDDEDQDGPDFKEAPPQGAAPGVFQVLCRERSLDDVLVGAPIPDSDNGRCDQYAEPGEIRVCVRSPEGEVLGVLAAYRLQLAPAAQLIEADYGNKKGTDQQNNGLDSISIDYCTETAEDGVDSSERDRQQGANPEGVEEDGVGNLPAKLGQEYIEDDAARIDCDRDFGEDISHERDDGQYPSRGGVESSFEEFWHCEDLRTVVEGDEYPGEEHYTPCVELPMGHRHSARSALAGQSYDVLRADIRGKNRSSDNEPWHVSACEEIISRRLLPLPHYPEGNSHYE